jgi:hypothetical protein
MNLNMDIGNSPDWPWLVPPKTGITTFLTTFFFFPSRFRRHPPPKPDLDWSTACAAWLFFLPSFPSSSWLEAAQIYDEQFSSHPPWKEGQFEKDDIFQSR